MIVDPKTSSDFYRHLLHLITPRPIAWVSTVSKSGVPNLAPFSFSAGVAANPPSHLFCPANHDDGREKDTLVNIRETGEYVVNIVSYALREQMVASSAELPREENEFEIAGVTPEPSIKVKSLRVKEAPAHLECKVLQIVDLALGPSAGHVVIGEILCMHIDDAVMREGRVDPQLLDTIGRMGGSDYCRTTDRLLIKRPR